MGGALMYKSGWFLDRFRMGAAFSTAQRLYGPKDRDGTLLLKPGHMVIAWWARSMGR